MAETTETEGRKKKTTSEFSLSSRSLTKVNEELKMFVEAERRRPHLAIEGHEDERDWWRKQRRSIWGLVLLVPLFLLH